jgi:ABC-type uncharacterized transport system YnjBCD permease subunit
VKLAHALTKGDHATLFQIVCTADFAKATAMTFAIVAAIFMSPLARMACEKVPALHRIPHCEVIIPAVLSALAITAARPPPL